MRNTSKILLAGVLGATLGTASLVQMPVHAEAGIEAYKGATSPFNRGESALTKTINADGTATVECRAEIILDAAGLNGLGMSELTFVLGDNITYLNSFSLEGIDCTTLENGQFKANLSEVSSNEATLILTIEQTTPVSENKPITIEILDAKGTLQARFEYALGSEYDNLPNSVNYSLSMTDTNTGAAVRKMKAGQDVTAVLTIETPGIKNIKNLSINMAISQNLEVVSSSCNAAPYTFTQATKGATTASNPHSYYNFASGTSSLPEVVTFTMNLHVTDVEATEYPDIYINKFRYTFGEDEDITYSIGKSSRNGWITEYHYAYGKTVWKYYQDGSYLRSDNAEYPYWFKDKNGNEWYCFDREGIMLTSQWAPYKEADGSTTWNYVGQNGSLIKQRWVQRDGSWVYLGQNGTMLTNRWIKSVDGYTYYVGDDGIMVTDAWVGEYYVDEAGRWIEGKTR